MNAPTQPRPFPGAPAYFRRVWVPPVDPPPNVIVPVNQITVIYGFAHTSDDPEDRQLERRVWRDRQAFMAWHFSPLCPEGEPGLVELRLVQEITAEQFAAALEAGWPQQVEAQR